MQLFRKIQEIIYAMSLGLSRKVIWLPNSKNGCPFDPVPSCRQDITEFAERFGHLFRKTATPCVLHSKDFSVLVSHCVATLRVCA